MRKLFLVCVAFCIVTMAGSAVSANAAVTHKEDEEAMFLLDAEKTSFASRDKLDIDRKILYMTEDLHILELADMFELYRLKLLAKLEMKADEPEEMAKEQEEEPKETTAKEEVKEEAPAKAQPAATVDSGWRYYNINNWCYPNADWEKYLYSELLGRGIAWYYPWAVAQIYGESNWNPEAKNANGLDFGLCQFRITYWDKRAAESGLKGGDIMDPYDSIHVYVWYINMVLYAANYDVDRALSYYYLGVWDEYSAEYVGKISAIKGMLK